MLAIGKGNSTKVEPKADYSAALHEASHASPEQEALSKAALKTLNWADAGDFRNPRAGGMFVNYADPAEVTRRDELIMNEGAQGTSALGTPDPNALANVRANALAHRAERAGGQYEQDIKEGVGMASAVAGDTSKMDMTRDLGVLNTTAGIYQNQANKPKWYDYVLKGAAAAVPLM